MLRRTLLILATLALLPLACSRQEDTPTAPVATVAATPFFTDVTAGSGLDFTYKNGEEADHYAILESLGGGVALFDYDGDGSLDVFVPGGGHFGPKRDILGYPPRLYKNLGGGKFRDATSEAGLASPVFYSHGASVGDYDGDGRPDLLVTGYGRLALFRNVGDGKFEDVTAKAQLADPGPLHWSSSAAWADLDGDGRLDLFVGHYVDWSFANDPRCKGYTPRQERDICPPERFQPLPPALYRNLGNGTFALQTDAGLKPGKTLGVLLADLDGDGKIDIYTANDGTPNALYRNLGAMKFAEIAAAAGVAFDADGRASGSMGVAAADYDGSGRPSLFVANYENEMHCLYRNLGRGQFQCVSRPAGITAIGLSYVGFGTQFLDFDRDGVPDLVIGNGHVVRHPASGQRPQQPVLLRNTRPPGAAPGTVKFQDVSRQAGPYFQSPHTGRGLAVGDLDNDGRVDVVVSHINEPIALLRNTTPPVAPGWLGIALVGTGPRDPVGAKLVLTQGHATQVRVVGNGSYLSTDDRRVLFALAAGDDYQLTVRWPGGRRQHGTATALGRDHYVTLTEAE